MPKLRSLAAAALRWAASAVPVALADTCFNVSYDPTRELYQDVQRGLRREVESRRPARTLTVRMSHGGSGKQARAVIDGLDADVVTLALAADIDAIAEKTGKLPADWQSRLPDNSSPYTSTIVFVVRKGNPKGDQGLGRPGPAGRQGHHAQPEDLGRRALELPRRLGLGARQARRRRGQGQGVRRRPLPQRARARHRCPRLDHHLRPARHRRRADLLGERGLPRARGVRRGQVRDRRPLGKSILAEPPVALVDGNVDAKGTRKAAEAYLQFLYAPEGQALAAKHYYRPRKPELRRRRGHGPLPQDRARRHRRASAAGRRRRPRTSATAASSTRSTSPATEAMAGAILVGARAARGGRASSRASGWRSASPSPSSA